MDRCVAMASAIVCLMCASAPGQAPAPKAVVIDGCAPIVIAISESGKTLYGDSAETGGWDALRVENPGQSAARTMVGSGVGCVATGKSIHAFSQATGHGATLALPEVATPELLAGRIRVDLGKKIHMFSGKTGHWATVDLGVDK